MHDSRSLQTRQSPSCRRSRGRAAPAPRPRSVLTALAVKPTRAYARRRGGRSGDMTAGLRASRAVLLAVNGLGVPVATESVPPPYTHGKRERER